MRGHNRMLTIFHNDLCRGIISLPPEMFKLPNDLLYAANRPNVVVKGLTADVHAAVDHTDAPGARRIRRVGTGRPVEARQDIRKCVTAGPMRGPGGIRQCGINEPLLPCTNVNKAIS